MLARQERGDQILRDLLRQMHNMQIDIENAAVEHAATLARVRPMPEVKVLEENSKWAHEEAARLSA